MTKTGTESAKTITEDRRSILARWSITADLTIETAAQIGSHESDYCDATFATDWDGKAILQGATLAGALRSALADRRGGRRKVEPEQATRLFGNLDLQEIRERPQPGVPVKSHESPVIVFDSTSSCQDSSIRDGVRISPETGTAAEGLKYDREVSLPGLVFPIRLDLVLTKEMLDLFPEQEFLNDLLEPLEDLAAGEVRFGARKSRGMGASRANNFRAKRYDLQTETGWSAYALSQPRNPLSEVDGTDAPEDAVRRAWPDFTRLTADKYPERKDQRQALILKFKLKVDGTLLIRSPGQAAEDADVIHLQERNQRILSGSTMAGVLRSHSTRILNTITELNLLKAQPAGTEVRIDRLFGPSPEQMQTRNTGSASRVIVSEHAVADALSYRQTRVKIDRFTGGTVDGALFEEQPAVGGDIGLEIVLQEPSDAEIGLLLLAARDLCQGLVPVGGGSSVGRGVVKGDASVSVRGATPVYLMQSPAELQQFVDALVNCDLGQRDQCSDSSVPHTSDGKPEER